MGHRRLPPRTKKVPEPVGYIGCPECKQAVPVPPSAVLFESFYCPTCEVGFEWERPHQEDPGCVVFH